MGHVGSNYHVGSLTPSRDALFSNSRVRLKLEGKNDASQSQQWTCEWRDAVTHTST